MKTMFRSLTGIGALIVLLVIASNSMPFYADGSRMGLFDGIPAIMGGASWTMPFGEGDASAKTDVAGQEEKMGPDVISRAVIPVGGNFGLDTPTTMIIIALLLVFIASMPLRFLRYAVAKNAERKRQARDRKARSCKKCGALDSYRLIDRQEKSAQPMQWTRTKGGQTVDRRDFIRVEVETVRQCNNCGYRIRHHGTEDYTIDANGKRTRLVL
jgi:hypothetical protein